jgi:transcriptional regulator with XRE-family HTH domain
MIDFNKERSEFLYYVKMHRKASGLTLDEFSKRLGVNKMTLQRYEKGQILPWDVDSMLHDVREVAKDEIRTKRNIEER